MPRLSLYRPNRTRDYQFLDRTISEMYTVGGVDIYVHKYLGPTPGGEDSATSGNADATQPVYDDVSDLNIQDLLLLENRDRVYDQDIYIMRGVYQMQDVDFDLTQFGLFLNNDTLFITFHYNDMIDAFGRKLMTGDVLELPNLRDYNPLNAQLPEPLPRYYVIQDAAFAAEGFTQTWLPHLWRVKATPLTDAQEYRDVLKRPMVMSTIWDPGNFYPVGSIVNQGCVLSGSAKHSSRHRHHRHHLLGVVHACDHGRSTGHPNQRSRDQRCHHHTGRSGSSRQRLRQHQFLYLAHHRRWQTRQQCRTGRRWHGHSGWHTARHGGHSSCRRLHPRVSHWRWYTSQWVTGNHRHHVPHRCCGRRLLLALGLLSQPAVPVQRCSLGAYRRCCAW